MRILVLCHEYPPVGGGAGAACALLSEWYVTAGHSVTVLTMSLADLPLEETLNGVRILRQPCGRRRWEMASPFEGLVWARRAWQVVRRLQKQDPFDVTHAHFIMPAGIVARWLQRAAGVPYVITTPGSDVPGYNLERLRLAHLLVAPWWKRVVHLAAQIVSPSNTLLELILLRAPFARAGVIPNGIDTERFRPGKKERRILLCSRLVERKGFQYFLEGIRDVDLTGWEIDIVGSGPHAERLQSLANGCRTPITWHGWMDNRDLCLAGLYARASMFIFPSERENCPIAILEGMSAGCAVVTTNVTGNPEVLGGCGMVVPPRDAAALRSVVQILVNDESRCETLGRAARQRVLENFEPELIAARYLEILQSARAWRIGK